MFDARYARVANGRLYDALYARHVAFFGAGEPACRAASEHGTPYVLVVPQQL